MQHVARGAAAVAIVFAGASAGAQVGHSPDESPFVDINSKQSFTASFGYFFAAKDPADVAPQSGPLARLQYDIYLGGPASFTARIGTAMLDRRVLDPARPAASRELGVERRPLSSVDVGFSFALTGAKTFHGFVPLIHTGFGLVSNLKGADPGGLNIGTRFALAYGAGLRYVPTNPDARWALRADLGSLFYQLRYPDRYFETALDSTSILPSGASKSKWLNNPAVTVGLTYQLFR